MPRLRSASIHRRRRPPVRSRVRPERRRARWLAVLATAPLPFVLTVGAAAAQRVEPEPQAVEELSLAGSAVDPDGRPLAGLVVELVHAPGPADSYAALDATSSAPIAVARTAEDGSFSLRLPKPGFWNLRLRAEARHPYRPAPTRWNPEQPVLDDLTLPPLEMPPGQPLTVTVLGRDGVPLAGARVETASRRLPVGAGIDDPESRHVTPGATVTATDESGRAEVLVSGTVTRIRAAAPGHLPHRVDLGEEAVATGTVTVRLSAAPSMEVVVIDADGAPAPDAVLAIDSIAVARTDGDGRALVPSGSVGAEAGRDRVLEAADRTGLGTASVTLPPVPHDGDAIRLQLAPPVALVGQVLDDAGEALPGAWVWLSPSHPAMTDARGQATLLVPVDRLDPAGIVRAARPGHFPGLAAVERDDVDRARWPTIRLHRGGRVTGTVVDVEGRPVADAALEVRPTDFRDTLRQRSRPAPRARSHRDGSFHIAPAPLTMPLELVARAPGFAEARVALGALEPDHVTEVEVRLSRGLRGWGTILDETERPVAGATVVLTPAGASSSDPLAMVTRRLQGDRDSLDAISDTDGRFRFDDLASGRVDLRVRAEGFAPARISAVEIPAVSDVPAPRNASGAPASFEIGTIVLSPGVALEGLVVDRDGLPLEGAELRVTEASDISSMVAAMVAAEEEPGALSAADGHFVVGSLSPGSTYRLDVERRGYAGRTVNGLRLPLEEPVEVVLEPAAQLTGVVLDGAGAPLPGASVAAQQQIGSVQGGLLGMNPGRMSRRDSTDAEGAFSLEDLAPGRWDLLVSADGYVDLDRRGLEIEPGVDPDPLRLPMETGATLRGRVLDDSGNPLAEVRIERVVEQGSPLERPSNRRSATTDGDGEYTLRGLPTGPTSFSADHALHPGQVRDLDIAKGTNRLDFSLDRGLRISGRVLDGDGLPVGGARVRAGQASGPFALDLGTAGLQAVSSGDGAYVIEGVGNGTYQVTAERNGFATAAHDEPVQVDGVDVAGIDLHLVSGTLVHGTVTGLSFDELAQVTIVAMQPGGGSTLPRMTRVDHEGGYRIENLAPGDWTIAASLGQTSNVRETIAVEPGRDEVRVDLAFGAGVRLTGEVLRDGEPVSGTMVIASSVTGPDAGQTTTDHLGGFSLEGLAPGRYQLIVGDLTRSSHREEVELASDRHVRIDLREASVAGRVVDARSGAALADAEVRLVPLEDGSDPLAGLAVLGLGSTVTGADGGFALTGVTNGPYRLTATLPEYGARSIDVRVEDADVAGLEIALQPAADLVLTVLRPSGSPATQVAVSVLDPAGQALLHQTRRLSEGGRLEIDELPDGTWDVIVAEPGGAAARRTVVVPGAADPILLPRAGGIRLLVPELAESGIAARASLLDGQGRAYRTPGALGGALEGLTFGVIDGRAAMTSVPVGVWTAVVETLDGSRRWETTVRVVEGTQLSYSLQ